MRFLLILCSFFVAHLAYTQLPNEILFNDNHFTPQENLEEYIQNSELKRSDLIADKHYKLIQFHDIPSSAQIKKMKQNGIELLSYIPNKAYYVSLPSGLNPDELRSYNIRHISEIEAEQKLSHRLATLDLPSWAKSGSGKVEVSIMYPKDLNQQNVLHNCILDGIEPLEFNGIDNFLIAEVNLDELHKLAALPYVQNIELRPAPSVPDDTPGRSLLRANMIDTQTPTGRNYTGVGVAVLCRDDGEVFDHVDFHGRLFQDFVGPDRGNHGDGVSGIMCGAGNKDPRNRGMAAGSDLYVLDYNASFLDETMNLFRNNNVIVTNSSYSNGCNAGYTNSTRTVDSQCHNNPTLLHVFSAGNSNNLECGYGAGDQWGNITGGHKQGKNVIATANTNNRGLIEDSSSRGPAHDGRIKPDLSSNGFNHISTNDNHLYRPFGGTSGAAPGIAGVTAMLHQAYRELNGEVATGALLKAIMLNTATDQGNKGPDFIYGWGAVNAYRSALAIEDNKHLTGTITSNGTQEHTITVPTDAKELRVMVYWSDPAAAVNSEKALVNDIDSYVLSPDGETHMPWVLRSEGIAELLELPAMKGEDHLNNMEQVFIEDPQSGEYILNLSGNVIPLGDHDYYVTWEIVLDEISLIYPFAGEKLEQFESEVAFWEAIPNGQGFVVSISTDDGATWEELADASPNTTNADIRLPAVVTDQARIKVTRGIQEATSERFTITPLPKDLRIQQVCAVDLTLNWDTLPDAISYDVYSLGEKYMDFYTNTTSTSITVPIDNPFQELWYAVSANFPNDIKGRRTIAISTDGTGLENCTLDFDLTMSDIKSPEAPNYINCEGSFEENLSVQVINSGNLSMQNIDICYQLDSNQEVCELFAGPLAALDTFQYTFSTPYTISENGSFELRTWVSHPDEILRYDDSTFISGPVYLDNGLTVPFAEGFSIRNFPEFWYTDSPEDDLSWSIVETRQKNGIYDFVLTMPFENYNANSSRNGELDYLNMIPLDFSNASGTIALDFDLAYFYSNLEDGLLIEVSTDCGATFQDTIYEKYGAELSTSFTSFKLPEDLTNWGREELDISQYQGIDKVLMRFVAVNQSGSNLYIDNINISQKTLEEPKALFSLSSNEVCPLKPVVISEESTGGLLTYDWSFGQTALPGGSDKPGPHEISYLLSGEKTISLTVDNAVGSSTQVETITVIDIPKGGFSSEELGGAEVQFTSNFTFAESYLWNFGDGRISTQQNPSHTFPGPGAYEVLLTVSNKCGQRVLADDLVVMTSSNYNLEAEVQATIAPNPNSGLFSLKIKSAASNDLDLSIVDITGIKHHNEKIQLHNGLFEKSFMKKDLTPGVYWIKLSNEKGIKTLKLVVTN